MLCIIGTIVVPQNSTSSYKSTLFSKVIVFSNMPSVLSQDQWPKKVLGMVEKGLMDYSVEVRVKASQVLSGLLHCAFIDRDGRSDILVSSILFSIIFSMSKLPEPSVFINNMQYIYFRKHFMTEC